MNPYLHKFLKAVETVYNVSNQVIDVLAQHAVTTLDKKEAELYANQHNMSRQEFEEKLNQINKFKYSEENYETYYALKERAKEAYVKKEIEDIFTSIIKQCEKWDEDDFIRNIENTERQIDNLENQLQSLEARGKTDKFLVSEINKAKAGYCIYCSLYEEYMNEHNFEDTDTNEDDD